MCDFKNPTFYVTDVDCEFSRFLCMCVYRYIYFLLYLIYTVLQFLTV